MVVLALSAVVATAKLSYSIAVASRPPDREHHSGHDRYETLASMAIAGLMAIGVVEILQSAVERRWVDK